MNHKFAKTQFGIDRLTAVAASVLILGGCGTSPPIISAKNLPDAEMESLNRVQEVIAAESKKLLAQQAQMVEQIRQLSTNVSKPVEPKAPVFDPLEGKNVSIAISNASISQVLAIFSDAAKVNLVVEPSVVQQGALSDMYLRDVSLRDAFNEVMKSYDVAGEIKGQTLRIRMNEEKFFTLSFLNITNQMAMNSGGNVFGANAGAGASSAISGNLSLATSTANRSDPYTEFENNLRMVLGESRPPSDAQNQLQARSSTPQSQSPTAVIQPNQNQTFTLNRTSGTLYVKARPSQMRAVEDMIKRSQDMLTKQVRIEAQLIDVELNDGYQFGVDWTALRNKVAINFGESPLTLAGATTGLASGANPAASITIPARLVGVGAGQTAGSIAVSDGSSVAVINALRSFGTLKVLSNPSIQTRNGTPAMLSVGNSQRYVSRSSSAQSNPGGGATTLTSDVQTDAIFSGVMVGVLPLLREDGRVELLINPVQSEVDPQSLQLVAVNNSNRVSLPQVAYKSFSTTLNIADGDVVVVGGLIDQKNSNANRGVPGISDIPLLGKLASQEASRQTTRELVVVLRVRIL